MIDWSATRINFANYCRRRYFLRYVLGDSALLPSYYRRGSLIHETIETFWDKLGERDEIKRDKKGKIKSERKYSNPEEFVDYTKRKWMQMIMMDEKAGRVITWEHENEKWIIYNKYIPEVCSPLFHILAEEGKPMETELKFDFVLGNRRFNGFIDQINTKNGNVIIRDYKTEKPWIKGQKLAGNPQLTLYSVAVCALAHRDAEFARKIGLEQEASGFFGNPVWISPRIKPEFFMVSAFPIIEAYEREKSLPEDERKFKGEPPKVINPTERTDKDFLEILLFLEDIEKAQRQFIGGETKRIPATEKGNKCDYCDMRLSCNKRLEEELSEISVPSGQMQFGFIAPYSRKEPKRKTIEKRFKWKR